MQTKSVPRRARQAGALLAGLLGTWALSACDGNTEAADDGRPDITIGASDTGLTVPAEVPSGLVDITLETKPGTVGHNLVFARLNDGVTVEEAMRTPDSEIFGLVEIKGGNGTIADVFDGTGTWKFVNDDPELAHEAAMARLADGKTAADLVKWAETFEGPPPIAGEFGSMGALGPGARGWMELEPVEPGDYVLICFVPGPDGVPHIAKGMVTPFTVRDH